MRLAQKLAAMFHLCFCSTLQALAQSPNSRLELHDGWTLQSACKASAPGPKISLPGFPTDGWHATTVPSTVVAALVADNTYPDPYFGDNLRSIPGTDYPVGKMFSVLPMPKDSPFRCSWWYRTEFRTPATSTGRHVWLNFGGINNRANIWLNGQRIAESHEVAGAYRSYEFDVTPLLARDRPERAGRRNHRANRKRSRHQLGGLESDAARQRHGPLARSLAARHRSRSKSAHPQVITHFPGNRWTRPT